MSPPALGPRPAKRLAIVTCMDARIEPLRLLGLELGDAHVIRNAGGIVTDDEIRSLAISQRLLGTEEVMLIHHTRCGMLGLADDDFRRTLREEAGEEPEWHPGGFEDLDEAVRDAIDRVRSSPFLAHTDRVRGYVYDVDSGDLREVSSR